METPLTAQERGIIGGIAIILITLMLWFVRENQFVPTAYGEPKCPYAIFVCLQLGKDSTPFKKKPDESQKEMVDRWLKNYCTVLPEPCEPWPKDLPYMNRYFGGV